MPVLTPMGGAVTNPPKKRGTAAETAVVKHLHNQLIPAERRALKGATDEGDVWLWHGRVVLEVKTRKTRPSDEAITQMWQEANREAGRVTNCDLCALILKRPGKTNPGLWWCVLTTADWLWALGVDPDQAPPGASNQLVTVTLADLAVNLTNHPDLRNHLLRR
jgi:hypothetical protein